jgi:predicted Holliday junction resolvase-like endonuclease
LYLLFYFFQLHAAVEVIVMYLLRSKAKALKPQILKIQLFSEKQKAVRQQKVNHRQAQRILMQRRQYLLKKKLIMKCSEILSGHVTLDQLLGRQIKA